MSLEEGLKSAMDVERKIRDLYVQAYDNCSDPTGKRFFAMMRDDEQYHHDYLSDRLKEIESEGEISYPDLESRVPTETEIASCLHGAKKSMAVEDRGVIQQMLSNALRVEVLTSEFYKNMVYTSHGPARSLFSRFLEIEDQHIAAVQAELDYVMNTGYWFDIKEFDME